MATAQTAAGRSRTRRAPLIVREPAVAITIILIASALAVFVIPSLHGIAHQSHNRWATEPRDLPQSAFKELQPKASCEQPQAGAGRVGRGYGSRLHIRLLNHTGGCAPKGVFQASGDVSHDIAAAHNVACSHTPLRKQRSHHQAGPSRSGGLQDIWIRGLAPVETLAYFPTAYLVLSGVLQAMDPSIEDAALDLGASWRQMFRTVTLPLAIPGLASALLLIFIESLADFGNPIILAGNYTVLATQAYLRITGLYDLSGGATLAVILLIPSLIAFFLQKYWVGRRSYVTVTGKPSAARTRRDEPWLRWCAFTLCLILTGMILLLYGTVFIGSFVTLWGANHALTLANYSHVFRVGWHHIRDTIFLSTVSTPITGILGMVIAFLVVGSSFQGGERWNLRHAHVRHTRHRGGNRLHPRVQPASTYSPGQPL